MGLYAFYLCNDAKFGVKYLCNGTKLGQLYLCNETNSIKFCRLVIEYQIVRHVFQANRGGVRKVGSKTG
jgi:hypothetical protein